MRAARQPSMITGIFTLVAAVLVAGFMMAGTTTAAPMKAGGSISARVQTQTELCEVLGGGKISVSYSYENGKMVSAQTVCKGGSEGGRVCVNDAKTTDCYKVKEAPSPRIPVDVEDLPVISVADSGDVLVPATPDAGLPSGEIESVDVDSPVNGADDVSPDAPVLVELIPVTPVATP